MIKVKLTKNNNYYKRIIITGHANYDDFGKDIVCAAVSSTVITSVNSCLAIDNESISYEDKNGLDIKVLKDRKNIEAIITKGEEIELWDRELEKISKEECDKILDVDSFEVKGNLHDLYELEKAYPKNIKIKEENNE